MCRTCTGTASFSGSPSSTTAPEADGHGEFSPQRVQTARWTSPVTNKLLLEAGLGNTYYQWGDRELDPNPTRDLIRVTENQAVINPQGTVGLMTYRSQNWLINKTDGANWFLNASYVTGSHSMKFGYQGNWWRDDREIARQHAEPGVHLHAWRSDFDHRVREPLLQQRARGDDVVLRAGSVDAQAAHAAGRAALRPSVELVPGRRPAEEHVLPRRPLRARRRRDRLQRHHAALGRRV